MNKAESFADLHTGGLIITQSSCLSKALTHCFLPSMRAQKLEGKAHYLWGGGRGKGGEK